MTWKRHKFCGKAFKRPELQAPAASTENRPETFASSCLMTIDRASFWYIITAETECQFGGYVLDRSSPNIEETTFAATY